MRSFDIGLHHKKRRIRKKYEIGEFAAWGFKFQAKFDPPLSEEEENIVWDSVITCIEAQSCMALGRSDFAMIDYAIYKRKPSRSGGKRLRNGIPTEADCEALRCWAKDVYPKLGYRAVITAEVGEIHQIP